MALAGRAPAGVAAARALPGGLRQPRDADRDRRARARTAARSAGLGGRQRAARRRAQGGGRGARRRRSSCSSCTRARSPPAPTRWRRCSVRVRYDGREATRPGREHRLDRGDAQGVPVRRPARARAAAGGRVSPGPRTLFEKVWDAHLVRARDRGHAGGALRRPAPGARGHLAAGVRDAARARAAGAPARPHARHHGPLDPDAAGRRGPDAERGGADGGARDEHAARLGIPLYGARPPAAGDRARDRARAGPDAAGHDDRLRRQPHQHPRRVRRARVRHRHERGRRTCSPSQCLLPATGRGRSRSRSTGALRPGVTAKDLILALIARSASTAAPAT